MSQRVTTLCIAAATTALVVNSLIAYVLDLEPAIFDGKAFGVLAAVWVVSTVGAVLAQRRYRRDLRERTKDLRLTLAVKEWEATEAARGVTE